MTITEIQKKKIKDKIETYEYYNNGLKYMNASDAFIKKMRIQSRPTEYVVNCEVHLCTEDEERIFRDCKYHLTKDTLEFVTRVNEDA
jgi:hypothetical protein